MKRIKDIITNKDLDIVLLIILLVSGETFFVLLNCGDELWNFANSYKMFNGYKIYEELNVIITPLFFYFVQIFFKLFGATMLTFRIYNVLIFSSLFILIYFIFKNLKIVRRRSIFYTIILLFIFNGMVSGGANYNILALIPILLNLLLILKEKENNILTGFMLFITFLIKQNIFVYYAIGIFIYKIITKKNKKQFIINIIKVYSIAFIGIIIFLIYMYLDNNLYYFIDYCFLGIFEFGAKNVGISFLQIQFTYLSVMIVIFNLIIINIKKVNKNMEKCVINNIKVLLSFGVPMLLIQYPIANYYHATLASTIILISFIYTIEMILIKNLEINVKKEKILYTICIAIFLLYIIYLLGKAVINENIIMETEGAYSGVLFNKEDKEDKEIVSQYIKYQEDNGNNVIILSHKANLYNINLNKNNGIFDLYFLGNLGKGGEQELINQIKELKNTIILTEKSDKNFIGQEAINARNYVKNNWNRVGEIQEYYIYEIK